MMMIKSLMRGFWKILVVLEFLEFLSRAPAATFATSLHRTERVLLAETSSSSSPSSSPSSLLSDEIVLAAVQIGIACPHSTDTNPPLVHAPSSWPNSASAYADATWPDATVWKELRGRCTNFGEEATKNNALNILKTPNDLPIKFIVNPQSHRSNRTAILLQQTLEKKGKTVSVEWKNIFSDRKCQTKREAAKLLQAQEEWEKENPEPENYAALIETLQQALGFLAPKKIKDMPNSIGSDGAPLGQRVVAGEIIWMFVLQRMSGISPAWGRLLDSDLKELLVLSNYAEVLAIGGKAHIQRYNSNILAEILRLLLSVDVESEENQVLTHFQGSKENLAALMSLFGIQVDDPVLGSNPIVPLSTLRFEIVKRRRRLMLRARYFAVDFHGDLTTKSGVIVKLINNKDALSLEQLKKVITPFVDNLCLDKKSAT